MEFFLHCLSRWCCTSSILKMRSVIQLTWEAGMINLHTRSGFWAWLVPSRLWVGRGSGHTSAIPPELICARGRGWFVAGPGLWAEFDHQDLCHRTGGKVGVVCQWRFFRGSRTPCDNWFVIVWNFCLLGSLDKASDLSCKPVEGSQTFEIIWVPFTCIYLHATWLAFHEPTQCAPLGWATICLGHLHAAPSAIDGKPGTHAAAATFLKYYLRVTFTRHGSQKAC